jgi:hypothetical protein
MDFEIELKLRVGFRGERKTLEARKRTYKLNSNIMTNLGIKPRATETSALINSSLTFAVLTSVHMLTHAMSEYNNNKTFIVPLERKLQVNSKIKGKITFSNLTFFI